MGCKAHHTNGRMKWAGIAATGKNVVSISWFVYVIGSPMLAIVNNTKNPFNARTPVLLNFSYHPRLILRGIGCSSLPLVLLFFQALRLLRFLVLIQSVPLLVQHSTQMPLSRYNLGQNLKK